MRRSGVRRGSRLVLGMATLVGVGLVAAPAGAAGHGDPGMFGRHRFVHGGPAPVPGTIQVVATGLDQPKKLTLDPAGDVIVALSGDGAAPASCTDGAEPSCLDESGAIDRVTPQGRVTPLLGGLPSVSSGGPGPEATGPVEAREVAGTLQVLFQDTDVDPTTGAETYGPAGSDLGELRSFGWHDSGGVEANFGLFEGVANPDHGAGTAVTLGAEAAIDSDPYSFVPYRGGYAVADAAANDLLFVSPSGHISVLAVFPTISEVAPPGTLGPTQTTPVPVEAQPVPDAVAVGPDGALYVGELGGEPFDPGTSSVYRVVPGQSPTVVATGFTAIGDLAFDPSGHLYVLEIDTAGIADPALSGGGLPTHGALIQVGPHGTQSIVASTGLEFPTGLVIASEGTAYVSNYGVLSATGGPGGLSGELVRVGLPR